MTAPSTAPTLASDAPAAGGTAGALWPTPWRGYGRRPGRAAMAALLALGVGLLVHHLAHVDWPAMRRVLDALPAGALGLAAALTLASYGLYGLFDLLGRRTTGHRLAPLRVMFIGLVAHACALNLGPAGAGVRLRLYGRHGVPAHLSAALWLFNVATNWLGFVTLAGVALATGRLAPAELGARVGVPLQGLGVALLAAVALYVVACAVGHRRAVTFRGVDFNLPTASTALLQCLLSAANWLLLGAIVHLLLRAQVPLERVMLALMASALALAVVDVPAGLGVTETVFLSVLAPQVPSHEVLGALLAYRAIYFVAPLVVACAVYLALEWDARRTAPSAPLPPRATAAGALTPPRGRDARFRPRAPGTLRPPSRPSP